MAKATRCFHALRPFWRSRTNLTVKGAVYQTLVRTVLLFGAAAWVLTADDNAVLQTWDASNLRFILDVSKRQHFRSDDCRARMHIEFTVEQEVRRARLRLFLKVARAQMAESVYSSAFLDHLIFCSGSEVNVKRGRPRKTWLQCLTDDLQAYNYGLFSARSLARGNATKFKQLFLA